MRVLPVGDLRQKHPHRNGTRSLILVLKFLRHELESRMLSYSCLPISPCLLCVPCSVLINLLFIPHTPPHRRRIVLKVSKVKSKLYTRLRIALWGSGYYNVFPPKSMNVSVKVMEPDSSQVRKKILVVNKDFAPGEVIYKVFSFHCPRTPHTQPSTGKPSRYRARSRPARQRLALFTLPSPNPKGHGNRPIIRFSRVRVLFKRLPGQVQDPVPESSLQSRPTPPDGTGTFDATPRSGGEKECSNGLCSIYQAHFKGSTITRGEIHSTTSRVRNRQYDSPW